MPFNNLQGCGKTGDTLFISTEYGWIRLLSDFGGECFCENLKRRPLELDLTDQKENIF